MTVATETTQAHGLDTYQSQITQAGYRVVVSRDGRRAEAVSAAGEPAAALAAVAALNDAPLAEDLPAPESDPENPDIIEPVVGAIEPGWPEFPPPPGDEDDDLQA